MSGPKATADVRLYVLDTGLIQCADYALYSPAAPPGTDAEMSVRSDFAYSVADYTAGAVRTLNFDLDASHQSIAAAKEPEATASRSGSTTTSTPSGDMERFGRFVGVVGRKSYNSR